MSLSRFFYEPFYTLSDFDRLFDEAFTARTSGNGNGTGSNNQVQRQEGNVRALRPRMDVHEDATANTVTASFELPGLAKEDVSIDVHNNVLTVSGETKQSTERDEHGWVVRERRFGRFARSIPLPEGVKPEEVKASLENGVLNVTFPKSSPEQAPKKITVS